jgi:hypothetical protein
MSGSDRLVLNIQLPFASCVDFMVDAGAPHFCKSSARPSGTNDELAEEADST